MADDEPFVDDRPQFNQRESRQTGLRDGFIRFEEETRLDEVQNDDD